MAHVDRAQRSEEASEPGRNSIEDDTAIAEVKSINTPQVITLVLPLQAAGGDHVPEDKSNQDTDEESDNNSEGKSNCEGNGESDHESDGKE